MPGWLKALLIVVLVIVVLVVGAVVAGVYYVSRNKDAWLARAKSVATEGRRRRRGRLLVDAQQGRSDGAGEGSRHRR